jgi:hypothetical protein
MPLALLELQWARPLGLVALALPFFFLWLARRSALPPALATGALDLWKSLSEERSLAPAGAQRRVPPSAWLIALALLLGALSLAGPRLVASDAPREFLVLVDHGPATALPWRAAPGPGEGGPTRLQHALAEAQAWLAREARPGDRIRWISAARGELTTEAPALAPADWLAHPRSPAPPLALAAFDQPGALLVSDRPPPGELRELGWFASGGAEVHGPVAAGAEGLWVWDGSAVALAADEHAAGAFYLDEREGRLPEALRGVLSAWAEARGVDEAAAPEDARLIVARAPLASAELAEGEVGRDGWRARARYPAGGSAAGEAFRAQTPWLLAPEGMVLVGSRPGRIDASLAELAPLAGDPALFAVSFAELFDAALLAHPEVVPLLARRSAGASASRAPRPPPARALFGAPLTRAPLDAWLAVVAALLALLALAPVRR